MRLTRTFSVVLLFAPALVVTQLHAQALSDTADASARARLRRDLKILVNAQETYYASRNQYAASVDRLDYRPSEGATVSLTVAHDNGWAGVATLPTRPGKTCVIWVNLPAADQPKTARDKRTASEG